MSHPAMWLGAFWRASRLTTVLPYSLVLMGTAFSLVKVRPNIELLIGIVVLLLSLVGSNLINGFYDFEFDKKSRYKRYVADALAKVGLRLVFWLSFSLPSLAVLASLLISPWHAFLIGVWNLLSILDAAPPLRVKERGLVRYVFFGLAQALLFLFFFALFSTQLKPSTLILAYIVGSISVTFAMVHEALDVYSDSSIGLRTCVARMGATAFLRIAWIVAISALAVSVLMPVATPAIYIYAGKIRRLHNMIVDFPIAEQEGILNRNWSTSRNGLLVMVGVLAGAASTRFGLGFLF